MDAFDFSFETSRQQKVHGIGRVPDQQPFKAICVGVHGYGEHCRCYENVYQALVAKNIGFVGFDLLGHGKSDGKRGYISHIDEFMDQINGMMRLAQEKFAGVPLFIYGHSMGGGLTAHFLQHYKPDYLTGAIITSAWFELAVKVPFWKIILSRFMSNIYPKYTERSEIKFERLSTDPNISQKYLNDELAHNNMTAGLFEIMTKYGKQAIQNASAFHLPTLVMHGTDDEVTSCKASEEYVKNAQNPNMELIKWEGLRHELHNELKKVEILEVMTNFILQTVENNPTK